MSRKKIAKYIDLCTGCGLCHSFNSNVFKENHKGFSYPQLNERDISFCECICPGGSHNAQKQISSLAKGLWGRYISALLGWSYDSDIRKKASSGGVLTSLCLYLLDHKLVDGIIQTRVSENPIETTTVISRTKKEIIESCGSRYSISTPLYNLNKLLINNEKYAFVGKPCDVSALKMYLDTHIDLKDKIPYLLSFFCAGEPSKIANEKLLEKLNTNQAECSSLTYRGNGWPGFATAIDRNGHMTSMSYEESWGQILGRDIRPFCRFCIDGIGLLADIACGDAWYTNSNGFPDFSEHEGRNIIFSRTQTGENIIRGAVAHGYIVIEHSEDYVHNLDSIQKYQYERKSTMYSMILAMKLFKRTIPEYDIKAIQHLSQNASLKIQIKRFIGTCQRIIKNKI